MFTFLSGMDGDNGVKKWWMEVVRKGTAKTAADPNARVKLMGMVCVLLIIAWSIPKADAVLLCAPCVAWAAKFCSYAVAAGGACAAVAAFPPALCACLLAVGGTACVAAAGTCAVVCLSPA